MSIFDESHLLGYIQAGISPTLSFCAGLLFSPLKRLVMRNYFRFRAREFDSFFSTFEEQVGTIQSANPYYDFEDIRVLHGQDKNLKLYIPKCLQQRFSSEEIARLGDIGIPLDPEISVRREFTDFDEFVARMTRTFGDFARKRLEEAVVSVAHSFAHRTDGALFNNEKYGVWKYQVSHVADVFEAPTIDLTLFETNYFTDRVLTKFWMSLPPVERHLKSEQSSVSSICYMSCSLGINIVAITSDERLVLTRRSPRVGLNTNRFHISMNEGLSLTDLISGHQVSLKDCAKRGLLEELGVKENEIEHVALADFFLERNHFQFGFTGIARLSVSEAELKHTIAVDKQLEIEKFIFLDWNSRKNVLGFIKRERTHFVPHGYYTLLKIMQRERSSMLRRWDT
jgi:hypothetical protein